jgi:hypothetical protein
MREVAQTMEDMLRSMLGGYKYGTDPRVGRFKKRSVPSMVQNQSQPTIKKRADVIKETEEARAATSIEKHDAYLKRGIQLKEKVQKIKEAKAD